MKTASATTRRKPRNANKASATAIDGDAVAAALDAAATRHRLLNAAGAVIAEVGYERAHVREICRRARANLAAIKYHFGGKYQLYEAAISFSFDRQERQHPRATFQKAGGSASDELRTFITMFVGRLLDEEKPAWHSRLMAREMIEPTGVLDKLIAQSMEPMAHILRRIVQRIIGPGCSPMVVERAMFSVIAQGVYYLHCKPVLERLFPAHLEKPDIAAIADHIATFSEAGLHAIRKANAKRGKAKS